MGENGASLSGGQKQRLAIACALYSDPKVLILDKATSSLDSISEEQVQNCIRGLKEQGKTIVLIAHRLGTILQSDKIIVLEKGKLMEEGSHTELYETKGKYYDMW
ncbi:ATP-binding cassette domain-containing protein, partial [Marinifilum sp. D737]|uniref:ATP-binding cassette domain-containing protein n=1 Tax=Marinifilum sp. D737 TaxID=2969628 RepID=UPI002274679B